MVLLERRAALVVTDSGGVQKEAFLQGTPCVTVRGETEWVELREVGWNRLADPASGDPELILAAISAQQQLDPAHPRPPLYGDGFAAEAIVETIQGLRCCR